MIKNAFYFTLEAPIVLKIFLKSHFGMGVPYKFAAYFQNTFS